MQIAISLADDEEMYIYAVGRSEFPISRTHLDSHAIMVSVGRNFQKISDANRKIEVSTFAPDCESKFQFPMLDATIRCDIEHTRDAHS